MNKYSVTYVKSGDTHTTNVWANSEGEAWSLAKQSLGWDCTILSVTRTWCKWHGDWGAKAPLPTGDWRCRLNRKCEKIRIAELTNTKHGVYYSR